ncbi:MAG TPA: HNH endonuclease [Usitatibacter sp.]|nr:HNH endonuclease [Usitatibacter sp.]
MLTEQFIESRVERIPFSGCWIWTGATVADGYGQVLVDGTYKRAHRAVYERLVGSIPSGAYLLHRCDVPCCVNPAHLYPGTQKRNVADCIERGRFRSGQHNAAKTHCRLGHEFNAANTGRHASGHRFCKTCQSLTVLRYQARKRGDQSCRNT